MFASHEFTSHGIHSTFTKSLDGNSVRAAFRRRRRIFTEFSRDTVSYATAFHMSWLSRRAIFSVVPLGAAFRVHLVSSKRQGVALTLYAERDRASFPQNLLGNFRFTTETSWGYIRATLQQGSQIRSTILFSKCHSRQIFQSISRPEYRKKSSWRSKHAECIL